MPRASRLKEALKNTPDALPIEELISPDTLFSFRHIAVTDSDQAYEFSEIADWVMRGRHDPLTRRPTSYLLLDAELQRLVEEWFIKHKDDEKVKNNPRYDDYNPLEVTEKILKKNASSFFACKNVMLSLHTAGTVWLIYCYLRQLGYISKMQTQYPFLGAFILDFASRFWLAKEATLMQRSLISIQCKQDIKIPIKDSTAKEDQELSYLLNAFTHPLYYALGVSLFSMLYTGENEYQFYLLFPTLLLGMITGRIDYNLHSKTGQGLFFHPKRIAKQAIHKLCDQISSAVEYIAPNPAQPY